MLNDFNYLKSYKISNDSVEWLNLFMLYISATILHKYTNMMWRMAQTYNTPKSKF